MPDSDSLSLFFVLVWAPANPLDSGDPAFVQAKPEDFQVRVILSDSVADLATQTVFDSVDERVESAPTGSAGPYDSLEIAVGALVDPALRCQLINGRGKKIVAVRGENIDTTFSDADKGPWDFRRRAKVSNIVCDPCVVCDSCFISVRSTNSSFRAFVAAPQ